MSGRSDKMDSVHQAQKQGLSKGVPERQQVRTAYRKECTDKVCCPLTRLVKEKDKSSFVPEKLRSDVA